ncbi:hypothetical protein Tco_0900362 [Tanacetum coccineum]
MTKRRRGNPAAVQVVFFPKAKPDTVAGEPGQWSPRVSVSNQPLTLTSEFGPGVNLGARLTRVESVCRIGIRSLSGSTIRIDDDVLTIEKLIHELEKEETSLRVIAVVSGSRPAVTSNWAVCCILNPPVLPPIPPEEVKALELTVDQQMVPLLFFSSLTEITTCGL